ncbi:hypothetical protein AMATHDRAFT_8101 [Amanita thiersii Skay4041]|uniref:Uncharacterized protein n=1 Tax=Amanita thiersii Skay4041 TaxID=703135 RepID=A0A2A9NEP8_9AGAR|nr:hypothetical protein AMATHDRAFT_8101 [Amanita thiersii Skay4041]
MLRFLPVLPQHLPCAPTHYLTFECNMFAALGEIDILFPGWYDGETGQLDHSHIVNVQGEGRDILQEVLQEGSGGNGLDESIGGRFWDRNLEVVVAVNHEIGHTKERFLKI